MTQGLKCRQKQADRRDVHRPRRYVAIAACVIALAPGQVPAKVVRQAARTVTFMTVCDVSGPDSGAFVAGEVAESSRDPADYRRLLHHVACSVMPAIQFRVLLSRFGGHVGPSPC